MGLKIVAAGAHLPTPTLAQTIEPTTAWAAVSFSNANTTYPVFTVGGLRRALRVNSGEGSAQRAAN